MISDLSPNGPEPDSPDVSEHAKVVSNLAEKSSAVKNIDGVWTGGTLGSTVKVIDGKEVAQPGLTGTQFNSHLPLTTKQRYNITWHVPEDFSPRGIDSTELTNEHVQKIIAAIHKLLIDPDKKSSSIVLGHGTDSLANTAHALSLMLQNLDRPIVLTGAQIRLDHLQSDGPRNIALALEMTQRQIGEVCVVFQGKVFRGAAVSKVQAVTEDAMGSPHQPPIAEMHGQDLEMNRKMEILSTKEKNSSIMYFPGMSGSFNVVEMCPSLNNPQAIRKTCKDYDGVVLKGYAAGNIPTNIRNALEKISEHTIVVVAPSAATQGRPEALYAGSPDVSHPSLIFAKGVLASFARTKLEWLHAQGSALGLSDKQLREWMKSRFAINFVGETIAKSALDREQGGGSWPQRYFPNTRKELLTTKELFQGKALEPAAFPEEEVYLHFRKQKQDWLYVRGRSIGLTPPDLDEWVEQRLDLPVQADMRTVEGTWDPRKQQPYWREIFDNPRIFEPAEMPYPVGDGKLSFDNDLGIQSTIPPIRFSGISLRDVTMHVSEEEPANGQHAKPDESRKTA